MSLFGYLQIISLSLVRLLRVVGCQTGLVPMQSWWGEAL